MAYEDFGFDQPEEERPSILARLVRLNRYIAVLLIIPLAALAWWPPFKEEAGVHDIVVALEAKRDEAKAKTDRLREKLDLIKTNPEYLEIMARDQLHLQKDGETIVRFENE